eukprot:Amastigsp_a841562_147.p3 type:complete len:138 gc:universal Amastigsp_a841562_147:1-414(+)
MGTALSLSVSSVQMAKISKSSSANSANMSSLVMVAIVYGLVFSVVQIAGKTIVANELFIVGGLASSVLVVLGVITFANAKAVLLGAGNSAGWFEFIVAELVALLCAGLVHRVCVTVTFLASIGWAFALTRLNATATA